MSLKNISEKTLQLLLKNGAQQAQVISSHTLLEELQYENNDFTLLRSVEDQSCDLTAITEKKKGSYSVSRTDDHSLNEAVAKTIEMAKSAQEDEAHAIATEKDQVEKAYENFESGPKEADLDEMTKLIQHFVRDTHQKYPQIGLRTIGVKFIQSKIHYLNSHGIEVTSSKGYYSFSVMFNANEKEKSSSMDFDSLSFTEFDERIQNLLAPENFGDKFKHTISHLHAHKYDKSFTGKAIFMPKCWYTFVQMINGHLTTGPLLAGTSKLQGKIGEKVGSSLFHIESRPHSPLFAVPSIMTGEGIFTKELTIFDEGVLNTYLVDLYGRNKLGLKEVSNFASHLYMPAGKTSLEDMISDIEEGILIGRFSGGAPNSNGDFSGIAKNSFIIKDGKIAQPLSETMISGNLFDLTQEIYDTSAEVYQNGSFYFPYVATAGITIS
tara:strand:- start:10317 stop:11627 length:1311 start_codon:yes stop_codon:yes gene_type:complete